MMSHAEAQAKPKWFSVVGWALFVWNLLGLMAFVMQVTMAAEALQALPEAQRAVYESYPAWATVAFGLAVIAGSVGALLLALGKALALPLLVASVVGVVVQKIHDFVVIDSASVFGSTAVIMSVFVLGASRFLSGWPTRAKPITGSPDLIHKLSCEVCIAVTLLVA